MKLNAKKKHYMKIKAFKLEFCQLSFRTYSPFSLFSGLNGR